MDSLQKNYDAVVIGSGPNGLAAAVTLAQTGRSVLVVEAEQTIGGGVRSAELTLPGFVHDICSAVHPTAVASPFLRTLPLAQHGLEWIEPLAPLAHPFDDGAVLVERSIEATAKNLGVDARAYSEFMSPLVADWPKLESTVLGPLRMPEHPVTAARFGILGTRSAIRLARARFTGARARGVFAGMAAHAVLPLDWLLTAAFGMIIGLTAHTVGWPFPRGGAQRLADALASYLRSLGGEIVTGTKVESLGQLPASRVVLCDMSPRGLLQLAGAVFPPAFRRLLERYRYGPGACKVDWALDGPIPWTDNACARAGTVHLGATLEEIEASERAPWRAEISERPFVLLAQPTLFDPTRAPSGKHVAWAYCHVPNGSAVDMSDRIENQIERFAPGFRRLVLKRNVVTAVNLQLHNANLVGGDFSGGSAELDQLFLRPTWRRYRTPMRNLYLCSASTPPGGGVHGMCGYWAAQAALRDHF